jgi:hypothetical protein
VDVDTKLAIAALREAGLDPTDTEIDQWFLEAFHDLPDRTGDPYRRAAETVADFQAQIREAEKQRAKADKEGRRELTGMEQLTIAFAHADPAKPAPENGAKKPGIQLLQEYFREH